MRFILVDEILELEPGRTIEATRYIDPGDDYFKDHFPGHPVVPGVLLTEMMAQTAGKCLLAEDPDRGFPMLAKINSANFRGWVEPGQTAVIRAKIRSSRPQFATAASSLAVEGKQAAVAELFFTFVSRDQFSADYRDVVLERFLAKTSSE